MKFALKFEIFIKRLWLKLTDKKRSYLRAGKCLRCGKCCRSISILLNGEKISDLKEFETLKAQEPEYEIFQPCGTSEDGIIIFRCLKQRGNLCSIHNNRPEICRDYPDLYLMYSGAELIEGCGYVLAAPYDFEEIYKKKLKQSKKNR